MLIKSQEILCVSRYIPKVCSLQREMFNLLFVEWLKCCQLLFLTRKLYTIIFLTVA